MEIIIFAILVIFSSHVFAYSCFESPDNFRSRNPKTAGVAYISYISGQPIIKFIGCFDSSDCKDIKLDSLFKKSYEKLLESEKKFENRNEKLKNLSLPFIIYTKYNSFKEAAVNFNEVLDDIKKRENNQGWLDGADDANCPVEVHTRINVVPLDSYTNFFNDSFRKKKINVITPFKECGCDKYFDFESQFKSRDNSEVDEFNLKTDHQLTGKFVVDNNKLNFIVGTVVNPRTLEVTDGMKCNEFVNEILGKKISFYNSEKNIISENKISNINFCKVRYFEGGIEIDPILEKKENIGRHKQLEEEKIKNEHFKKQYEIQERKLIEFTQDLQSKLSNDTLKCSKLFSKNINYNNFATSEFKNVLYGSLRVIQNEIYIDGTNLVNGEVLHLKHRNNDKNLNKIEYSKGINIVIISNDKLFIDKNNITFENLCKTKVLLSYYKEGANEKFKKIEKNLHDFKINLRDKINKNVEKAITNNPRCIVVASQNKNHMDSKQFKTILEGRIIANADAHVRVELLDFNSRKTYSRDVDNEKIIKALPIGNLIFFTLFSKENLNLENKIFKFPDACESNYLFDAQTEEHSPFKTLRHYAK